MPFGKKSFQKRALGLGHIACALDAEVGLKNAAGNGCAVCARAAALDDDGDSYLRIIHRCKADEDTVVCDVFALLCSAGLTSDGRSAVIIEGRIC